METDKDLKELEQKVFRTYFKDGLWDIYGALLLTGFGLTIITGWDYLIIAFAILAVTLLFIRRRIIVPRLGRVKFSSERQIKTKRSKLIAMVILTLTMLAGVVFFMLFATNSVPRWLDVWMSDYFFAVFGGMIAILVAAAAYVVGVWRYYLYAVLILVAYVVANWLRTDDMEGIPIIVAGGILLISGAIILTRFLRRYPLPPQEPDGE